MIYVTAGPLPFFFKPLFDLYYMFRVASLNKEKWIPF